LQLAALTAKARREVLGAIAKEAIPTNRLRVVFLLPDSHLRLSQGGAEKDSAMPVQTPSVNVYSNCSNLDLATGICRRSKTRCTFAAGEHHACADATFVARVTTDRHEFQMLVDREHKPATAYIPVRTCRQISVEQAAGVHVNSIGIHGAQKSLLQLTTESDGSIRYRTALGDAAIHWREGQFSVMDE
jgi:hypothetical protein